MKASVHKKATTCHSCSEIVYRTRLHLIKNPNFPPLCPSLQLQIFLLPLSFSLIFFAKNLQIFKIYLHTSILHKKSRTPSILHTKKVFFPSIFLPISLFFPSIFCFDFFVFPLNFSFWFFLFFPSIFLFGFFEDV